MHQPVTFSKVCYIQFNNGKIAVDEYNDIVEQSNEYIIAFIREVYEKVEHGLFGGVARVLVVIK